MGFRVEESFKPQLKINVTKKGVGEQENQILSYAYEVSGKDKDFIYTMVAENGTIDPHRVGITKDIGLCQISPYYHPHITNDPRFKEWKWQVEKCWELYSGGTRFYGYDVRHKVKHLITFLN